MSIETSKAIAVSAAKHLIEEHGKDIESMSVYEYVADELPGLDSDKADEIEELIFAYIKVARVCVEINHWIVKDDGSIMTDEERRLSAELSW